MVHSSLSKVHLQNACSQRHSPHTTIHGGRQGTDTAPLPEHGPVLCSALRQCLKTPEWGWEQKATFSHCNNSVVFRLISFTNFNAQFLYSLTICMLHYNPRHVLSINMPIFRRTNCIITASGIVALCKRLHSMPIPDAVIIQFVLLKMGMLMLETCRGL